MSPSYCKENSLEKYILKRSAASRNLRLLCFLGLTAILYSCSWPGAPLGAPYSVLNGNYRFNRGEEVLATYHYLQADDEAANPWVLYNLGNVYLSLGELDPGVHTLEQARRGQIDGTRRQVGDLLFRIAFNLGVAHYDKLEYAEAAAAFVEALKMKSGSWDAKINLELSQKARQTLPPVKPSGLKSGEKQHIEQILEQLRQIHLEEVPAWAGAQTLSEQADDW